MPETLKPATEDELREMVAAALAGGATLEIAGGGSKRALGRPMDTAARIDVAALQGVSLYEPDELVLTAGAGTPLAEIEALVAENNQQLAFEPPDWGALLGAAEDATPTLGGMIACNLAGPRRLRAGAARDHFLGVRAVSGRGELFKSGGRVVKNVTGYDMCKLLAGSYGTLGVMSEITIKVLPAPEKIRTLLAFGLIDAAAIDAMAGALGSPHEISGAAHLPAGIAARSGVGYVQGAGAAVTALRIEGHAPSVDARCDALRTMLAGRGEIEELHRHNSNSLWREIANVAPLMDAPDHAIWRISAPPTAGAALAAALAETTGGQAYYDWGGGLIWLSATSDRGASHEAVREALAHQGGGHATLIRAEAAIRASTPVFHPQPAPLAALSQRIKNGFDPNGILNPGRMYEGM